MVLDPWNLLPAWLTWSRIYISQEISRTHLFISEKEKKQPPALKVPQMKIKYLLL